MKHLIALLLTCSAAFAQFDMWDVGWWPSIAPVVAAAGGNTNVNIFIRDQWSSASGSSTGRSNTFTTPVNGDMIVIGVDTYNSKYTVTVDGNACTLQVWTNYYDNTGTNAIWTYAVTSTGSKQVRVALSSGNEVGVSAYVVAGSPTVESTAQEKIVNAQSYNSITNTLTVTSAKIAIQNLCSYTTTSANTTNLTLTNFNGTLPAGTWTASRMGVTPATNGSQIITWTNRVGNDTHATSLTTIGLK